MDDERAGLGWKAFALINAGVVVSILVAPAPGMFDDPLNIISTILSLPAAIGLLIYAFNQGPGSPRLWAACSWMFGGYSIVGLVVGCYRIIGKMDPTPYGILVAIGAIATVGAHQYFTWVALWRLSHRTARMVSSV